MWRQGPVCKVKMYLFCLHIHSYFLRVFPWLCFCVEPVLRQFRVGLFWKMLWIASQRLGWDSSRDNVKKPSEWNGPVLLCWNSKALTLPGVYVENAYPPSVSVLSLTLFGKRRYMASILLSSKHPIVQILSLVFILLVSCLHMLCDLPRHQTLLLDM